MGIETPRDGRSLRALSAELTYQAALGAALVHDIDRVEGLLSSLPDADMTPAHYVLLGKARAQSGRLPEAIEAWDRALAIDPTSAAAQAGVQQARAIMGGRTSTHRPRHVFGVLTAALALSLVGLTMFYHNSSLGMQHTIEEWRNVFSKAASAHDVELQRMALDGEFLGHQLATALTSLAAPPDRRWQSVSVHWDSGILVVRAEVPSAFLRTGLADRLRAAAGRYPLDIDEIEVTHSFLVEPGDTLSGIALLVLGDATRYDELFRANADILDSPHVVPTGIALNIPE